MYIGNDTFIIPFPFKIFPPIFIERGTFQGNLERLKTVIFINRN